MQDPDRIEENYEPISRPPVFGGGTSSVIIAIIISVVVAWAMIGLIGVTKTTYRSDITRLENDLVAMRGVDSNLTDKLDSAKHTLDIIAGNYVSISTLNDYALKTDLNDYVKGSELSNYTLNSALDSYYTKSAADNITSNITINLTEQVNNLTGRIESLKEQIEDIYSILNATNLTAV